MIPAFAIDYPTDPRALYGPRHGNTRPFPLPPQVRRASIAGAAAVHVGRQAGLVWAASGGDHDALAEVFVATVEDIARAESRMMFALPADRIGAHLTGWGVFQFDREMWREASRRHLGRMQDAPWQASAAQELAVPILCYREAAQAVHAAGGEAAFVARGIWTWQISRAAFRAWLLAARTDGFAAAWGVASEFDSHRAERDLAGFVDGRLRAIGLLEAVN